MSPAKHSPQLQAAIAQYDAETARGYLGAATNGLPPASTVAAMQHDLDLWRRGERDPGDYDAEIDASREYFANLIGTQASNVAIGAQTSVMVSVIAAAVPAGATVLCVEGDFTSVIYPFLQRADITVRFAPLDDLATSITDETWLVVYSLIQSSDGRVADVNAITAAASEHGAYRLCDVTQAAGVHPVDASQHDAVVCHAYKWLCCPRGVGFMALAERFGSRLVPVQAGWYAGDKIWESIYGSQMALATTARRFDTSPAWQAWAGGRPALQMFSTLDIDEVWRHTSGLGDRMCQRLDLPPQHQAIITWPDPDGSQLRNLQAAGIRASGRAGRLRLAFHLWNDDDDIEMVAAALRR